MVRKLFAICLLSAAVLIFSGCENEIGGFTTEDQTVTFQTFNTRMGENDLPLLKERAERLKEIVTMADSDILCIQEVFDKNEIVKISQLLKDEENGPGYVSTVYVNTSNDQFEPIPPQCSQEDVTPVLMCIMMECGGMDPA